MNLQFLTGNPKKGRKKSVAKSKGKSTIKPMRKIKKNPVVISREKNGKMKKVAEFMTSREIDAVRGAMKHGAKKGTKSQQKAMSKRVGKIMLKEAAKHRRAAKIDAALSRKNAKLTQGGLAPVRVERTIKDDIRGALKKAGVSKYAKKNDVKKALAKKAKAKKASDKAATRERILKNLGIKSEEELKNRLTKLKGKSVAKKKKRKSRKKAKKVIRKARRAKSKVRKTKHKSKKVAMKNSHKRKHYAKKAKRSKVRRKSSSKGKYLKSVKSIVVYASNKKGKAKKIRTHKRPKGGKLSAYIKNPFGGAMKGFDKINKMVQKGLGHSGSEAGALFVAGGVLGALEGAVTKYVSPHLSFVPDQIKPYLPSLGSMTLASAGHYFAEEKFGEKHILTQVLKAVVAASLVKAGDQILGGTIKSATGLSGVYAIPMGEVPRLSRGYGEVPRLSRGVSGISKADFDYGYEQSRADFGEIPKVMNGVLATPMSGVLATPMGSSTQSSADFGRLGALDPSADEQGDYEDSDVESMA